MISEKLKKRKPLDTNRRRRRRKEKGAGSVNRPRKGAVGSTREGKREEQKKDKRDPLKKRRERNVSNQSVLDREKVRRKVGPCGG